MKTAFSVDSVFGSHMVIQRGKPVRIGGFAPEGVDVAVMLGTKREDCTADKNGRWEVEFSPFPAGGPVDLVVCTPAQVAVKYTNILFGDVWYCSGQSNMEFHVHSPNERFYGLPDGESVAKAANDGKIRLLTIQRCVSPEEPCTEIPFSSKWEVADTYGAVAPFSAVGYFFGKELRSLLDGDVPIGLINGSWGGSRIEPWIPKEAFMASAYSSIAKNADEIIAARRKYKDEGVKSDPFGGHYRDWIEEKFRKTDPEATRKALSSWHLPSDGGEWTHISSENLSRPLGKVGTVWYRCSFSLPEEADGTEAAVHVGHIDDSDEAWLDGVKIGETTPYENGFWTKPRNYAGKLQSNGGRDHFLVFRIQNHFNVGSLSGEIAVELANGLKLDLASAKWEYRVEFYVDANFAGVRPDPEPSVDTAVISYTFPSTLFNAMVSPCLAMNIKGVIWYQGCSNSSEHAAYYGLQSLLIDGWRKAWRDEDMPFIITQLASFHSHRPHDRLPDDFWHGDTPLSSIGYAPMREVQQRFLEYKNTGVVCAIDIGDHSDIHPVDKLSVGKRMAHEAMRVAYGQACHLPGPVAARALQREDGIEIFVENASCGLEGESGSHSFAVIGDGDEASWVEGKIMAGDKIFVRNGKIKDVKFVRYGYSSYLPPPYIRRKGDGLPLFPFNLQVEHE